MVQGPPVHLIVPGKGKRTAQQEKHGQAEYARSSSPVDEVERRDGEHANQRDRMRQHVEVVGDSGTDVVSLAMSAEPRRPVDSDLW